MTVIVLMYFIHYQKHRKEVDNRFLNFVCKNFLLLREDRLVQGSVMFSFFCKNNVYLFSLASQTTTETFLVRGWADSINIYLQVFSGKLTL